MAMYVENPMEGMKTTMGWRMECPYPLKIVQYWESLRIIQCFSSEDLTLFGLSSLPKFLPLYPPSLLNNILLL